MPTFTLKRDYGGSEPLVADSVQLANGNIHTLRPTEDGGRTIHVRGDGDIAAAVRASGRYTESADPDEAPPTEDTAPVAPAEETK